MNQAETQHLIDLDGEDWTGGPWVEPELELPKISVKDALRWLCELNTGYRTSHTPQDEAPNIAASEIAIEILEQRLADSDTK